MPASENTTRSERDVPVLLCYGFRPFFLLAGIVAIVPVIAVAWLFAGGDIPFAGSNPYAWHAHEMLFGFVSAAIAGFLLTAVPSWTGTKPLSGLPLLGLVILWVLGRAAALPLPDPLAALLVLPALAFFPALAAAIAVPLIKSGNKRNLPFIVFLALLFLADAALQMERLGWLTPVPFNATLLGINTVMLMIVIVGGRIVPAFTRSALAQLRRPVPVAPAPWLDVTAVFAAAAVVVADLLAPTSRTAGILAAATAALLAARLARWYGWRTLRVPLLWVLHVGYAWLVVALALKASWLLGGAVWAINWMHALTAGAFATMILAVTTRAALGHTGRPLVASRATALAYLMVTAAAALRVWGPPLSPTLSHLMIGASALLWTSAFSIYLFRYAPMLARPRVDGRPG
jgi:uncharacterized protein involved in response to NO